MALSKVLPPKIFYRVGEKNLMLSKLCYASAIFLAPIYWTTMTTRMTTTIITTRTCVLSLIHMITLRGSNYHFNKRGSED